MYVQYGCGFSAPAEWLNFDASPTLRFERLPVIGRLYTKNAQRFPENVKYGDIVNGLSVPEESCRGVYASHVLEHLALDDFHTALTNTRKILQSDGIFRMVVPDLEAAARQYLRGLEEESGVANSLFMESTSLGRRSAPRGVRALLTGFQTSFHMWMWDSVALQHVLEQHGFRDVRRCSFGDCSDPMFRLVEDKGRFESAVAMEARR